MANLTSVNLDKLVIGKESWKQQFIEALSVNGGDIDDAEPIDFVLHFVTFGWKVRYFLEGEKMRQKLFIFIENRLVMQKFHVLFIAKPYNIQLFFS